MVYACRCRVDPTRGRSDQRSAKSVNVNDETEVRNKLTRRTPSAPSHTACIHQKPVVKRH